MKIIETNIWRSSDVRSLCIREGFYTCGDCVSYQSMLNFVDTHKPTKNNIYKVAADIYNHSNEDDNWNVETIMFYIRREVVCTFYELEEE